MSYLRVTNRRPNADDIVFLIINIIYQHISAYINRCLVFATFSLVLKTMAAFDFKKDIHSAMYVLMCVTLHGESGDAVLWSTLTEVE